MASTRYRRQADGTPTWQVRFRHAGKERSQSFDNERDGKEFARLVDDLGPEHALRILSDRSGAATAPPLAIWCAEYVDNLSGVQEGTRGRYRRIVETRLGRLGKMPIDVITADDVAGWVNGLHGVSGKTVSNYHGFLSAAMKAAVRRRVITYNPCDGTRLPQTAREDMVILTPDEFARFLPYVREDARGMVTILPATGLRFGEVTALRVRDVNLDAGTITVVQAWKYVEKGAPVLGPPKSKKSRRTIRVPQMALDALARNMGGKLPDDLVFTNTSGRPWTRSRFHEGVWQPATRAAQPALGKKPRVHDMRHACASWLLASGADMYTVQRYLGHESFTTTEGTYAHLDPVRMNRAADALSLVLPQLSAAPE